MATDSSSVRVEGVHLDQPNHAAALIELLDHYARDPMGGAQPLSEYARAHLVHALRAQPYVGFLAFEGAEAVGLVNGFVGFSTFAATPLLYVHDIVVRAGSRGRGIGRRLLEAVEHVARARGYCKLTLEVLSGNHGARAAYERFGFRSFELDPAMGQALFLEKKLS